MIPLLLTATVNPNGMQGASFSVEERAAMYVEAINFYLQKLPEDAKIVFVENSGSLDAVRKQISDSRVEWLDVSGSEYDITKGKGYNEIIEIQQAVAQSESIGNSGCFFKVTGRLKVLNIAMLLKECAKDPELQFLADCKDHGVYDLLRFPINGHAGECRYWFASSKFFLTEMLPLQSQLNDYTRSPFLAEDAMLVVCRKVRRRLHCRDRFRTQARISGKGGHVLGQGASFFYSTDNDSAALKLKCYLRQLLRWIAPFWRC